MSVFPSSIFSYGIARPVVAWLVQEHIMAKGPAATRDNKGNPKTAALSAPKTPKHQTRKSLAGAPTALFEHLMVHLRQMRGFFSGKFSREFSNKSALYEIISMIFQ